MRRDTDDEVWDAIYEVFYSDTDEVTGWDENPASVMSDVEDNGESELKDEIARFMKALERPTLDWKTGKEIQ